MSDDVLIRLAAIEAAHGQCSTQRLVDRATLDQMNETLTEIRDALAKVPWRVLNGNGIPPIDVRVDRLEQAARRGSHAAGRMMTVLSLLVALGSLAVAIVK